MIRSIRTKVIISMMSLVILSGMFLGYVNYMDSEKLAIDIIKRNNKAELENINEYYFEKLIFDMEYIVETWANNPQITNYVKSDDNHYVRSIPEDFINIYEKWLGLTESMKNVTWLYYALEEDGSIYIAPKQSNIFLLNEKLEVLASNENAPENLSTYAKKAVSGEQELFTLDKIQYVSTYVPISINNWKLVALLEILEDDMKN